METNFWDYSDERKIGIFNELYLTSHLNPKATEKDWWVCHVIKSVFGLRCADALTFKGGTSLSKAWNVTNRFSEDVDISIDKSVFGLNGDTRSQRDRIRKLSQKYIANEIMPELNATLRVYGAEECEVTYRAKRDSDADPTVLLIPYRSLLPEDPYIKGTVKVEFSCRNLREPREIRQIKPIVCEQVPMLDCLDIRIPTVVPTRTFLEKVFLLQEEYQKDYPRYKRMSRHLYDIVKLDEAGYCDTALADTNLFDTIVEHRRNFSAMRGINYDGHKRELLQIVPPANLLPLWEDDYRIMKEGFIYGQAPTWKELLSRLELIQDKIRD